MIFREEECVSLGWCFWHRACYGCIFCSSRVLARGPSVRDLFFLPDCSSTKDETRRGGVNEIEEIPLCQLCAREIEEDGVDEGEVMRRGLERIAVVDGGVTTQRIKLAAERIQLDSRRLVNQDTARLTYESCQDRPPATGNPIIWIDLSGPIDGDAFRWGERHRLPWFMQRKHTGTSIAPGQYPF